MWVVRMLHHPFKGNKIMQSLITISPLTSTPFDLYNIPERQVMLLLLCNRGGSRDSVCEQCTQVETKANIAWLKIVLFSLFCTNRNDLDAADLK